MRDHVPRLIATSTLLLWRLAQGNYTTSGHITQSDQGITLRLSNPSLAVCYAFYRGSVIHSANGIIHQ